MDRISGRWVLNICCWSYNGISSSKYMQCNTRLAPLYQSTPSMYDTNCKWALLPYEYAPIQSNGGTSIHIQASQGQIHLSMNRIHLSLNRNARAVDDIQKIFSLRPRHTSIVNLLVPEETLYLYRCFLDVTIAHSQSDGINTRDWCDLRLKVIDRGAIIKSTCTILYTTRASPKLSRLSWPISYEAHIISYHPGLPP